MVIYVCRLLGFLLQRHVQLLAMAETVLTNFVFVPCDSRGKRAFGVENRRRLNCKDERNAWDENRVSLANACESAASMVFLNKAFTCSLVPFDCYGGLRLRNSIVGVPTSIEHPYRHLYSL